MVQRSPTLRAVFERSKKEGMTPEQLAGAITPELERALDCEPEAAIEVAQYLADEYFQLGDAVLICDRATGRAIARLTDDDMYQPPVQQRESGEMVQPLPRLNPNLEGFLVSYIFEEARDRAMTQALSARLPHTAFLTETFDPRLRAITRAGRTGVAQEVRAALPDVLEAVQGTSAIFLRQFEIRRTPPEDPQYQALPQRTAEARGRQLIVDPKAMNLRFSWEATLKARTGTGWVREIAGFLVDQARSLVPTERMVTVTHPLFSPEHVEGTSFWAGDPATCIAIQRVFPPQSVMPGVLPCAPSFQGAVGFRRRVTGGVLPPAGYIVIPEDAYSFTTREVHGRWEMVARMEYTLYVHWDVMAFLHVTDIPVEAIAEIL